MSKEKKSPVYIWPETAELIEQSRIQEQSKRKRNVTFCQRLDELVRKALLQETKK